MIHSVVCLMAMDNRATEINEAKFGYWKIPRNLDNWRKFRNFENLVMLLKGQLNNYTDYSTVVSFTV